MDERKPLLDLRGRDRTRLYVVIAEIGVLMSGMTLGLVLAQYLR